MSYINIWQGFPSHCFSRIYCCFHNRIFCIDLFPLIKDNTLSLDSMATDHSKVEWSLPEVWPTSSWTCFISQTVNRRQQYRECRDAQRYTMLSFQVEMVICKMNVARQKSTRLTGVNTEMKMIAVSSSYIAFCVSLPYANSQTATCCNTVSILTWKKQQW